MRRVMVVLAACAAMVPAVDAQPAGGASHTMVRAAGMPLQDGALAPGMLTVRVVRGAFSGNVPGLVVHLDVTGSDARQATTGADGRAEFAHLAIGSRVRAWAEAGTERFESESFEIPSQAGVRLLFVSGGDASTAAAPAAPVTPAAPVALAAVTGSSMASPPTAPAPAPAASPLTTIRIIRIAMVAVTLVGFAVVLGRKRPARDHADQAEGSARRIGSPPVGSARG